MTRYPPCPGVVPLLEELEELEELELEPDELEECITGMFILVGRGGITGSGGDSSSQG